ncbi:hypothetical protein [Desulfosporosinus meridiei]|uniref:Uncharacterized protein n=1 Tax=Desulfosporosinus meridiei (strain ATCC BAA-275 / DSM 13257 / KCTC 12902 / NCIMB 13706 / S10) TaxID=768704 RepID=J7IYQ1_DESMD|nr:hypothetical protein [Desulfosporosinus meridiei]AFQ45274.1 hypothetical protein Desmer_3420 [Desulfosporosinus meridiei DSM 13257]
MVTEDAEIYLPDMHIGENRRDAAPGVRGFLFQDLLAVEELIKEETEYVCSEYIEDVCAVTNNGVRIIQAKYTPKTNLDIEAITRELYYQYIKLRQYGYSGDIIPVLSFHADVATKPDEEIAKQYLNLSEGHRRFQGTAAEIKLKVKECIQTGIKKERENNLFASFYELEDLRDFLRVYKMEEVGESISSYRKALGEKLDTLIKIDCCPVEDTDNRQDLLIALATKLVQDRYNEPDQPADNQELLKHRKVIREDFFAALGQALAFEQSFNFVIQSFVDEAYCELVDEQLSPDNHKRLNRLYVSTNEWVKNNLDRPCGVVQLLNTVSTDSKVPSESDRAQNLRNTLYICKDRIITFYHQIWKIKLNLRQETFEECLLPGIGEYIAFSFQNHKDWSRRSIIMSSIGDSPRRKIQNVQKRVRAWNERPQKWYLRSADTRGFGDYSIDVARIAPEELDVASISPDRFVVECMECIGIDEGEWAKNENCADSIFSKKCKYGGKS